MDLTPSTDGDGARSYIVENTETGEFLTTDPVNVGTYKATYSVAEGTNYQAGSISDWSWILIPEQMHRNLSMPELIRFTIGSQHRTTNLTQEARL